PAAAAAATRARRLRIGDLHGDPATVQLAAVELGDRVLRFLGGVHLDESEAARLTGEAVGDHGRGEHVAALGEKFPQPIARRGIRETADIELGRHVGSSWTPFRYRSRPERGRVTSVARSGLTRRR